MCILCIYYVYCAYTGPGLFLGSSKITRHDHVSIHSFLSLLLYTGDASIVDFLLRSFKYFQWAGASWDISHANVPMFRVSICRWCPNFIQFSRWNHQEGTVYTYIYIYIHTVYIYIYILYIIIYILYLLGASRPRVLFWSDKSRTLARQRVHTTLQIPVCSCTWHQRHQVSSENMAQFSADLMVI